MVAIKVYKKSSPNGKLTAYLEKRDFIDYCDGHIEPVEGIVQVEHDYLKGRKVFGQIVMVYRFGREEDEVMGVKFSKNITVARGQIIPLPENDGKQPSKSQEKLIKKLDNGGYPFQFLFPNNAPSSVTLQSGEPTSKPLGVTYMVKLFVGDDEEDPGHKRSSISMMIKKLQYAPATILDRLPSAIASKGFTFSQGKVNLEVTLNKEIFYHGESINATVIISNNSRKSVKNIKIYVMQYVELTVTSGQICKEVSSLETREGCPITPGVAFKKVFSLLPLASSNKDKRGIALDGHLKEEDVNLASSTIMAEGRDPSDAVGILISYTVRVKINLGTLGGDLHVDVPLKLVHPPKGGFAPKAEKRPAELKRMRTIERAHYEDKQNEQDEEENLVFEDYSRTRMSVVEE